MADETQVSPVPLDGLEDSRKAFLTLLAGMSRTLNAYAVSYTHLTLPTNREV